MSEPRPLMPFDAMVVAILIERLGGKVTISDAELASFDRRGTLVQHSTMDGFVVEVHRPRDEGMSEPVSRGRAYENAPLGPSLYPEGYRDPEWDGTEADFAAKVLPARIAALTEGLNERYAGVLPEGVRFAWVTSSPKPPPENWLPLLDDPERSMRAGLFREWDG